MTDKIITGFLSYTVKDNRNFQSFVSKLKQDLISDFEASTGLTLKIFTCEQDISQGERWQTKIQESLDGSQFFIPVITHNYFKSKPCREEFTSFEAQDTSGNSIIPVILRWDWETESDSLATLVSEIQVAKFQEAQRKGYKSSSWNKAITQLSKTLQDKYATNKEKLEAPTELTNQSKLTFNHTLEDVKYEDTVRIFPRFVDKNKSYRAIKVSIENLSSKRRIIKFYTEINEHEMILASPITNFYEEEIEGESHVTVEAAECLKVWGDFGAVAGRVKLLDENGRLVYTKEFAFPYNKL